LLAADARRMPAAVGLGSVRKAAGFGLVVGKAVVVELVDGVVGGMAAAMAEAAASHCWDEGRDLNFVDFGDMEVVVVG